MTSVCVLIQSQRFLPADNTFTGLFALSPCRAMQKMKQVRRLKLGEVKVLAEEGIELNAVEYQRQVEEREAQRKQEREERLAREAMMTLEAMEREEQEAAKAAAKATEPSVAKRESSMSQRLQSVLQCCF